MSRHRMKRFSYSIFFTEFSICYILLFIIITQDAFDIANPSIRRTRVKMSPELQLATGLPLELSC